jgi:hypothetical protein
MRMPSPFSMPAKRTQTAANSLRVNGSFDNEPSARRERKELPCDNANVPVVDSPETRETLDSVSNAFVLEWQKQT